MTHPHEELAISISRQPELLDRLVASLCPSILGNDEVKEALLYLLVGGVVRSRDRGSIHVLIIGDLGTGKSTLLNYVSRLHCSSVSVTGSLVNLDGLSSKVALNEDGQPIAFSGALTKADNGLLIVDQVDIVNAKDLSFLSHAMVSQGFHMTKDGLVVSVESRSPVLAAGKPSLGRYNHYQTLLQNLRLPISFLSSFDLIFLLRDEPDGFRDYALAERLLDQEAESEPPIPFDDLRIYLEHARDLKPVLRPEAASHLRDFYVEMRRASRRVGTVSLTAKQVGSLRRISEAHAKLHLRDTVTLMDAEAAVRLMTLSLQQVGVDPLNLEYDIDALYTGRPRYLSSRLLKAIEAFIELEKISEDVSNIDFRYALYEKYGFDKHESSRIISMLIREGLLYVPKPGVLRRAK
jgi:replicative DNA helicase Mcm